MLYISKILQYKDNHWGSIKCLWEIHRLQWSKVRSCSCASIFCRVQRSCVWVCEVCLFYFFCKACSVDTSNPLGYPNGPLRPFFFFFFLFFRQIWLLNQIIFSIPVCRLNIISFPLVSLILIYTLLLTQETVRCVC